MQNNSESIVYHGFTLETILTQEGTNVRGWLVRVFDRTGAPAGPLVAGPWISRREARAEAERAANDEIGKLGEPRPSTPPAWHFS